MERPIVGPRAVLAIAVATACSRGAPRETRIEAELRRSVGAALALPVTRVACAGSTQRCIATVEGVEVPLAIRDTGNELAWEIAGLVVSARVLETAMRAMLDELAVTAVIDCGPRVRVVAPGERVGCRIEAAIRAGSAVADTGRAWATFDAEGTAELEVALGAAAVSARTEDVATADLDALSRALDRDDAGSGDGEEPTAGASFDAAVPGLP
jgi:hypothetical protein